MQSTDTANLLREIPPMGGLMESAAVRLLTDRFGQGMVKLELRAVLDELRERIRQGTVDAVLSPQTIARELEQRLARILQPVGRSAINATGILLHTGLGRAPLCREAIEAMSICDGYSVLQASLDTGDRSLREEKIQRMLIELTGCEAATIVNNNAAATMLILNTLAAGKEVIISRGQLIEIGGAFRMTDVMAQSSALLREVGTTNRTHLRDYEGAIGANTGAIIHVHTSNYRIRGFTGTPSITELVALGRRHNIPVVDDLGSGALVPLHEFGLSDEPLVRESVSAGTDVVCFSGDKLICGPQAGLIIGKQNWIAKIRKNPYARMFRVCKLTLAGMEATLPHFINDTYRQAIPFYRMLARSVESLRADAVELAARLGELGGMSASIAEDISYIGSGSIPDEGLPTIVVRVTHAGLPAQELAVRLRKCVPSVFGRLQDRALIMDLRTLLPGEPATIAAAMRQAVGG